MGQVEHELMVELIGEIKGLRADLRQQSVSLLTLPEAAAYLRIGQRTLDRVVAKGEITPANVGERRIVFRRADLDRFVQKRIAANAN